MLKKLRRRYVAISMSIVCMVLIFVYLISCTLFFLTMIIDIHSVLQTCAESTTVDFHNEIGGQDEDASIFMLYSGNVCVVDVKEHHDITVLEVSRAKMDNAILTRAVDKVITSDDKFGIVSGLNLFYYKNTHHSEMRIAFADSTQFSYYLRTILFDGGIVLVLSSIFLWLIMRFLMKICLRPVEKAWEQQKNFIADASHELKTPLTVILTNSGILKSHAGDTISDQMQWIDSTYDEANYMKELVDKLLLLAKTDNQSRKNLFTDVDLSDIAMQLALQYEPVAFENGVVLNTEIEKNIHIPGDELALNQIIHILLDNAIKYTEQGGSVTLSLKKKHSYSLRKNNGYIYLSSHNTGKPIPKEDIPYLFERFYRSDKARTSGSGYGLGLSICKNLAALHKADVSVTSDEENGTVFTVKFKL